MNIFITLDYELFLGVNPGTIDNCIIRPMNDFLTLLDKYQIKCTIFVDTAFLLRLKELGSNNIALKNEYERIASHILLLHTKGHDIQLHFHPQWFYSSWENGKWLMDLDHFKLSDMDERHAFEVFYNARLLLQSITGKRFSAFRAGGFSLTAFNYIDLFKKNNIKIDSSVLGNSHFKSKLQCYDYRSIPAKSIYKFSTDITIEDSSGEFIEIPVTTIKEGLFIYCIRKIYKKHHIPIYGDGIMTNTNKKNRSFIDIIQKILKIGRYALVVASIDGINAVFLPLIYAKLKNKDYKNMIVIGHPKFFSKLTFEKTEEFIKKNMSNISFLTISHLLEEEDNHA
jgi:hypothetical protein